MKPDPGVVLVAMAEAAAGLAVDASTPWAQQVAGIMASLDVVLAQEIDRLPQRLLEENAAIIELLVAAGDAVGEHERAPADYRLSTLQAMNDQLRARLIDVHARVEAQAGASVAGAAELNDHIWHELWLSTRRRHVETFM